MTVSKLSIPVTYYPGHGCHDPQTVLAEGRAQPAIETPARIDSVLTCLREDNGYEFTPVEPLEFDDLTAIHRPDYLEYIRRMSQRAREADSDGSDAIPYGFSRRGPVTPPREFNPLHAGWYCADTITPITPGAWEAARGAAAAARRGAQFLLEGRRIAYAACRPPGHHAGQQLCGGFCYVNNAAIAANELRSLGAVAILDIDTHHGNGTQAIFYDQPGVLFVSVHGDPVETFPFFWGHASETGLGPGEGATINLPLKPGSSAEAWFEALEKAMDAIDSYAPNSLVLSLGVDVDPTEPVTGGFALRRSLLTDAGRRIAREKLPTLVVQEGGYIPDHLADGVCRFLRGLYEGASKPTTV
jgi:acetoin utilization deacetylase AcuC-like enzyme